MGALMAAPGIKMWDTIYFLEAELPLIKFHVICDIASNFFLDEHDVDTLWDPVCGVCALKSPGFESCAFFAMSV